MPLKTKKPKKATKNWTNTKFRLNLPATNSKKSKHNKYNKFYFQNFVVQYTNNYGKWLLPT